MNVKIFTVKMGFDQCYLLKSEGVIAIDAGAPGKINNLMQSMKAAEVSPKEL
jgi:hypothetical protein